MKTILKSTFFTGLLLSLSVVATNYLNSIIQNTTLSTNALIVAVAIAVVGFVGKFLSGVANTNVSMLGAALLTIVPLLTEGKVDWTVMIAMFLVKLIGLYSSGKADLNQKDPKFPYTSPGDSSK